MVRRSRRAFCEPGPRCCRPAGHGWLIALACTARGFLRAPREATQHAPDRRGTIGDTPMTGNHRGHTPQGPACMPKTMGSGALAQQVKQGLTLRSVELWCAAGVPFGGQARLAVLGT